MMGGRAKENSILSQLMEVEVLRSQTKNLLCVCSVVIYTSAYSYLLSWLLQLKLCDAQF